MTNLEKLEKLETARLAFGKEAFDLLFKWISGKDLSVEEVLSRYSMHSIAVISDMDGVLTDSTSSYSKDGKALKDYGAYDTEMMLILSALGCQFYFYTSDKSGCDIHRARWEQCLKQFGEIETPDNAKTDWYARLAKALELKREQGKKVLYVGDSISDLNLLSSVDWLYTTDNAPDVVKHYAAFTSKHAGGYGGFADCLEHLLIIADWNWSHRH